VGALSLRPKRSDGLDPSRTMDAALALRHLLNPMRRNSMPGGLRRLVVAGVWPDGHGFSARFEAPRRSGVPVSWARWRDGLEMWPFPDDPALPALPPLIEAGYQPIGHRLGRRATLGAADGSHLLHLRPGRSAAGVFNGWVAIHDTLSRAGVKVAQIGPHESRVHAMRSEWVRSEERSVRPDERPSAGPSHAQMSALGETLGRAHAATPPSGLAPRGPGPALDSAVRQVGLAVHSGTAFTQWLERRLERWKLMGAPRRHARALVHGDLQLGHVAWADAPVILDWDRAGPGDPEEDLGNLAADLLWRWGPEAAPAFAAFRGAYRAPGGSVHQELFDYYARLSLVKLLSVRAMSEADQVRLRTGQEQWSGWPEAVATW